MTVSAETYRALGLTSCKILHISESEGGTVPAFHIILIPCENNRILSKERQILSPETQPDGLPAKTGFLLVYDLNALLTRLESFKTWKQIFLEYEPKIDVRELSAILLPFEDHPPGSGLEQHSSRVSRQDDYILKTFQKCVNEALGLPLQIVQTLHYVSKDFNDGLGLFFRNLNGLTESQISLRKNTRRKRSRNIIGEPGFEAPPEKERMVDPRICHEYFKEDGIFSQSLAHFEYRKGQEDMAEAVLKSMNRQEFLVAEAGTGIGKSLAYLVPALFWLAGNPNQKVVISTHTKTLQHQLFSKELPFLKKELPEPFCAVLMKGRSNYLCLKRWEAVADDPKRNLNPAERRQMLPLVVWAEETGDGDIDMHSSFASDRQGSLWRKLNADSPDCDRMRCPRESVCFLQRIRKAARQADLVLVNHALLFSDLSSSGSIIGPYSALIVDEAHQVEKVASNHLGLRLHSQLISDLVQSCMPARGQRKSLHTLFQSSASELRDDAFLKLEKWIHTIQQCADRLDHSSGLFFNQLKIQIPWQKESSVTKIRLSESPMQGEFQESGEAIDEDLKSLHWSIAQCAQWIQDESFRTLDELLFEFGRVLAEIERIRLIFEHFTEADYEEFIVWQEVRTEREDRDVILQSVPLHIGQILAEKLYPRLLYCVFTSATLSVAGEFDYLIRQLGLDQVEPERLSTRVFGSPFLYDEQVFMGIPAFLPEPNESDYIRDASDLIQNILKMHPRGTLVLFTSNAMLQSTYTRVKSYIVDPDHTLMAQGIDGNRDQLLDRFRSDQSSILFGTSSFWEGIDVPGPALETLIITRIPFEVPTDPIVQARTEYIEKLTGNGFMNYTLPEAIIRLRQGFGRLIRSSQDYGMILLMDMRLLKKSYGRRILDALPAQARVFQTENALFDAISTWFHTAH